MPADFNGYWKMLSNDNFEEYLKALDVNIAIRKIANMLKPDKEIIQKGDHMIIKTLSTFKNYIMDFHIGKEFEEDLTGVDDRKCMVRISTSTVILQKKKVLKILFHSLANPSFKEALEVSSSETNGQCFVSDSAKQLGISKPVMLIGNIS
ncbi:hypothetical protein JD844_007255 [Phrynosoma platyrhinos]|uniref:Cytosolic fatty-acid binding proteins domain-containing protein n=1 Tax=Phrynosoma platyrhinos TaxID=52577 RepID=A0ABQ7T3D5_PHRPL|nr:hypothetical protein JD844_007255 [Phrynosoma platyrhinos]